MFKLYYFPGACSLAPHLVLEELGLPFELVKLNPDKGDLHLESFLKLNPLGVVPVLLLEDGTPLTEAGVILQYLADQKPESGLLEAAGTKDRYHTLEKISFIATELHKGFGPIFSPEDYVSSPEALPEFKKNAEKILRDRLSIAESWFSDGRLFVRGGHATIADFYLQVVLNWAKPVHLDLSEYHRLSGFMARMRERPNTTRAYKTEFSRS